MALQVGLHGAFSYPDIGLRPEIKPYDQRVGLSEALALGLDAIVVATVRFVKPLPWGYTVASRGEPWPTVTHKTLEIPYNCALECTHVHSRPFMGSTGCERKFHRVSGDMFGQ